VSFKALSAQQYFGHQTYCSQQAGTKLLAAAFMLQCTSDAGLKATGVLGIWWQAISLVIAVVPVWLTQLGARLPASTTSHVLLGGLVASRFGLWLFDLSVSQMLQEWVPAEDIGRFTAAVE
jgi:iron-regulated transporter 1